MQGLAWENGNLIGAESDQGYKEQKEGFLKIYQ